MTEQHQTPSNHQPLTLNPCKCARSANAHLHVHFESDKDTANGDFTDMLLSFAACGTTKAAVTDHGVFSAYEDVLDAKKRLLDPQNNKVHLSEEQKKGLEALDFIPGVEGYFAMTRGEPTSHMLLIAKDDIGYQSLCKIITQSNLDYVAGKQKGTGKPVITLENLQKYAAKGHLICTTACIAGVFGTRFGLRRMSLEEKIAEQVKKVCRQPLDTEFVIDKEMLLSPPFKHLLSIKICPLREWSLEPEEEATPFLLRDLLREDPKTEAERLLYQYRMTLANWEIRETLRKEKPPKAPKGMQPSHAAIAAYEARKTAYDQCKDYQKKKPKKVLFTTLEKLLEQLLEFPNEEMQARECRQLYQKLIRIFGKRDFYFELQYHGLESERVIYRKLIDFAEEMKNTNHFIASNDVHIGISKAYIGEEAWEERLQKEVLKRDVISFTRFNKFMHDDDTITPDSYEYYIKDDGELREWLSRIIPEEEILDNAFSNLKKALDECHVDMADDKTHYPAFCEDADALFERKVREGVRKRFPNGFPSEEYEQRMEFELTTIKQMGYSAYHLIVADYLEYGRLLGQLPTEIIQSERCPYTIEGVKALLEELHITPNAYPIGPGRGSAVGSLCCYLLGITDIDPIPYNLLFFRYLNPERISMPDIDSDFSEAVREACIEYVRRKYGYDCVCSISTKAYAGMKGALRIAGRYLGTKAYLHETEEKGKLLEDYLKPYYNLSDKLCKLFDDKDCNVGAFLTAAEYLHADQLIKTALSILGCFTGYGQHAAGTIISRDTLSDHLPLMYAEGKQNMETQCNMGQAESKGYLKMDFLGLRNLDILTAIMRVTGDISIADTANHTRILTDPRIYKEIYSKALTQGVFQFESIGMKRVLTRFQPECFEDIILLNAAYRPGPMQFLDEMIAEKWYRKALESGGSIQPDESVLWNGTVYAKPVHSLNIDCPALKEILAPTYGCIIYQEQIMQICVDVAGFTMGRADAVRKYMSKKKEDELLKVRPDFVEGCIRTSGLTKEQANQLFDCMVDFAKYAFNKSHATAYAEVSVFTAYEKLYHPGEFFAESLNAVQNLDEVLDFVKELPMFGLQMKTPDLMRSGNRFVCVEHTIYFGLSYIKGLSDTKLVRADSLIGFVLANRDTVTAKTAVKLADCGLFDSLEPSITRQDLAAYLPTLYKAMESMDKKRIKQEELEDIRSYLQRLSGKERLSLEEKVQLAERLKLRRKPETLSISDVKTYLASYETKLHVLMQELADAEDTLDRDLQMLRINSRKTCESVLYNRAKERELMGFVADINDSLRLLEGTNPLPPIDEPTQKESDIVRANVGLVILDPCVKVTPGGWVKALCMDTQGTYRELYFTKALPTDMTEMVLTIKKGKTGKDGHVFPYAYRPEELGQTARIHYYVERAKDFYALARSMHLHAQSAPVAYLHCMELGGMHVLCTQEPEFGDIAYKRFCS